VQQQQPDSVKRLCALVSQTEDLDRIYTQALRNLRRSYAAQERVKSAMLVANQNGSLNGLGRILDDVTATLKQIQSKVEATQITRNQLKILRALEPHSLTLKDLTYHTGLPLEILKSLVQNLRHKGHIDLLSAPLLYWLFPGLKPMRDRQTPLPENEFLSLTATGYFRLHPVIRVAQRGNQ
jgi:hypothetical protein